LHAVTHAKRTERIREHPPFIQGRKRGEVRRKHRTTISRNCAKKIKTGWAKNKDKREETRGKEKRENRSKERAKEREKEKREIEERREGKGELGLRSGITERRDATRRVEGRKEAEAGDRRSESSKEKRRNGRRATRYQEASIIHVMSRASLHLLSMNRNLCL